MTLSELIKETIKQVELDPSVSIYTVSALKFCLQFVDIQERDLVLLRQTAKNTNSLIDRIEMIEEHLKRLNKGWDNLYKKIATVDDANHKGFLELHKRIEELENDKRTKN